MTETIDNCINRWLVTVLAVKSVLMMDHSACLSGSFFRQVNKWSCMLYISLMYVMYSLKNLCGVLKCNNLILLLLLWYFCKWDIYSFIIKHVTLNLTTICRGKEAYASVRLYGLMSPTFRSSRLFLERKLILLLRTATPLWSIFPMYLGFHKKYTPMVYLGWSWCFAVMLWKISAQMFSDAIPERNHAIIRQNNYSRNFSNHTSGCWLSPMIDVLWKWMFNLWPSQSTLTQQSTW